MAKNLPEHDGWPEAVDRTIQEPIEVDERMSQVVEHPDGWYWIAPDGHQQFGPFESVEALAETERVMGLADWIDPDTGTLAEDSQVRLEEH